MTKQNKNHSSSTLRHFLRDSLFIGCLRGFKYFKTYPRGKEELLLTVFCSLYDPFTVPCHGTRSRLMIPPASPLSSETSTILNNEDAVFLVGGYTVYNRVYVWERSMRRHLSTTENNCDSPLSLDTTSQWTDPKANIKLFDIISELVLLTFRNSIENPFEIDRNIFSNLSEFETTLLTGGLLKFLSQVFGSKPPYASLVFKDYQFLSNIHFQNMYLYINNEELM